MRIAFVTFEYPPFVAGGAGIYALNITRELANLGHQIVVFTPDICENISEPSLYNVELRKVPVNKNLPFNALQFWLRLPNEINKAEKEIVFDIIHFNGISYWFLKKRLSKAKHVVTIHHLVKDAVKYNHLSFISRVKDISSENSLLMSFFEKRCIKFSDKLISVSHFTKKQIINSYKMNPDKIDVIYNGTSFNDFLFTKEELEETKKQLRLENRPIVLFVGRVDDPRKGLILLLNCVKKILEKVNMTLLVVGKGNQSEARKLINLLGISNNVIFTGYIDDENLKKCYSICDVYVCPSNLEGFGLTILEAMSAGKPIIATNTGAIPEVLADYGTLVTPESEIELSEAIIHLLTNYKVMKQNVILNPEYKLEFSWSFAAKKLLSTYEDN